MTWMDKPGGLSVCPTRATTYLVKLPRVSRASLGATMDRSLYK